MNINRTKVKKILVVSLSNIGDVILTFPVVDILKRDFPQADISIVVGPKSKSLFEKNQSFSQTFIFDKHQSIFDMARWVWSLRKEHFDLVVDLRNTAIGFFLTPRYRTPLHKRSLNHRHMKQKHLNCLKQVLPFEAEASLKTSVTLCQEDKEYVRKIISNEIGENQQYVVVAPGAADQAKRWDEKKYASLCDLLIKNYGVKVCFVGSQEDKEIILRIQDMMRSQTIDLSDRVNLLQLSQILLKAQWLIGNDSAPMHLASYLDTPVVAIFGPTDPKKYGPWGKKGLYLQDQQDCFACLQKQGFHTCMNKVLVENVLKLIDSNKNRVESNLS